MGQEKTTLEIIAPTVDEAIQKGLAQFGLSRELVDVEVLDAGSRGFIGIGSRQARVRLSIRVQEEEFPAPGNQEGERNNQPAGNEEAEVHQPSVGDNNVAEGQDALLESARKTVMELLDLMHVPANVTARFRSSEEPGEDQVVEVNVEGNDLSILIGKRSETLNALQYIAGLIISKKADTHVSVQIDIQGFRERREKQLRVLARRMAEQAITTGKRQFLEPMPANERRLIHLELRNHPKVETESVGEEPNRKVTIFLKK
ncbi:MAG TPA: RNA-binding cell elongation regulator Jag/EloR [Anaerolineaceae bacterium]